MQGKQTDPPGNMNGILMGMISMLCYFIRDVVDHDDGVKQEHHHEENQKECKIVKKHKMLYRVCYKLLEALKGDIQGRISDDSLGQFIGYG